MIAVRCCRCFIGSFGGGGGDGDGDRVFFIVFYLFFSFPFFRHPIHVSSHHTFSNLLTVYCFTVIDGGSGDGDVWDMRRVSCASS